jgi:excisionase family DNA binding protein
MERALFDLPVLEEVEAKLRQDLEKESNHDLRLRLYDLCLQELEAALAKGERLYAQQVAVGELVNPEDYAAYAGRLLDSIARYQLERDRLRLAQDRKVPKVAGTAEQEMPPMATTLVDSFAPSKTPKNYPDVMTVAEVAELLRYKLPRFYQVYKSLGIPFFMEGRQPRFEKADILSWMQRTKAKT